MPPELTIILVTFVALFAQSLVGFGAGLISMPLLAAALGLKVASPLFSLVALVLELVILVRYRTEFNFGAVWRLMLMSIIGIPIGIASAGFINERFMLLLLGIVVFGYGAYALVSPHVPQLNGPAWPYVMGFLSGLLTGAYNTGGSPLIIYGTGKAWSPQEFKANIQSLFIVSSFVLIVGHLLSGNYTPLVLRYFLVATPAAVLAIAAGFMLEGLISPPTFRKGVLVLLVVLGLTLIF